jgi:hypothetical protein
MRPVSFAYPIEPEKIVPLRAAFVLWRYTLVCDDATEVPAEIRIYRAALVLAQSDPGRCRLDVAEAVDTNGRSVIEHKVLMKHDPPLNWIVHINVILPDITPPE